MEVKDSMSRFVVCLNPQDSLAEAYDLMDSLHCRHLPIIENRKLVGIVSDRDILLNVTAHQDKLIFPDCSVKEIMTKDVVTVYKDCEVGHAVDLMLTHKIDALPVTGDEGQLVGIVTSSDLLELLRHQGPGATEKKLPWTWNLQDHQEYRAAL